jgi:hypothetical protein
MKENPMLKHILATSALATLLATGAYAQTEPAADPAQDPAAPVMEDAPADPMTADPMTDEAADPLAPESPDVAQDDPAADPAMPDATTPPEVVEDDTMAPDAGTEMTDDAMDPAADPSVAQDWAPVDLSTVSVDQLIGADIVTQADETIASIEDVLITDGGQVENIVARFGGFLGFGADRVLLTPDEIEVLQDPNGALLVRSSLTPEAIEGRPVYEEEAVEG